MYYQIKIIMLGKFIQVIQLPTLKESRNYLNNNFPNQPYQINKMKKNIYSSDKLIKTYE